MPGYSSLEYNFKWLGRDNPKASTVCPHEQELCHQVLSLCIEQMETFNGGAHLSSSHFPHQCIVQGPRKYIIWELWANYFLKGKFPLKMGFNCEQAVLPWVQNRTRNAEMFHWLYIKPVFMNAEERLFFWMYMKGTAHSLLFDSPGQTLLWGIHAYISGIWHGKNPCGGSLWVCYSVKM